MLTNGSHVALIPPHADPEPCTTYVTPSVTLLLTRAYFSPHSIPEAKRLNIWLSILFLFWVTSHWQRRFWVLRCLDPHQGGLTSCDPPGGWSVSVWRGGGCVSLGVAAVDVESEGAVEAMALDVILQLSYVPPHSVWHKHMNTITTKTTHFMRKTWIKISFSVCFCLLKSKCLFWTSFAEILLI